MIPKNKISLFILELIKMTKKGQISWQESFHTPILPDGIERLVDLAYSTTIKEKSFRLYKYNTKHFTDEYEYYWSERIRFELIDNDGNSTFEFPYEYSLNDLYDAVRESSSGINEFIDDFFKL